jgi:alpha-L-fucosidase
MSRISDSEKFSWWNEARFGLCIHWGLYSLLERGEWVMFRERIPKSEYARLADRFQPKKFNADEWAALAKKAGMRYIRLVTRHHDGFSLWDSQVSDFTSVKTAAKRDFVEEIVEAFRKIGMRIGFYYSLMDWRYPAYWLGKKKDPMGWKSYCDYVHTQVRELMTNYGQIDALWWDAAIPHSHEDWEWKKLNDMVRHLQKNIVISGEDFDTSEGGVLNSSRPWEVHSILSEAWSGYHKGVELKSARQIIHNLVRCVVGIGKGSGNYTVNVGPKGDGSIAAPQALILKKVGAWLRYNGESIYGAGSAPFFPLHVGWGATSKKNIVYIHVMFWPGTEMCIAGIKNQIIEVSMLATGESLRFEQRKDRLFVRDLPEQPPDPIDTVIAVKLNGKPSTISGSFWKL